MKFYLEQLINALNDSDIEKLKSADLKKSKIKNFLGLLIERRKTEFPKEQEIRLLLDLDDNSYRKMKAVLLAKCIKILVPEGGIKLLEFLGRYSLSELFMREAEKLITAIEKNKLITKAEKAAIYKECYMGSTRLPYSIFDESKLKVFETGFLKNYLLPDKLIVFNVLKLNGVFVRIVQSFFSMKISEENYNNFKSELLSIENNLNHFNSERINVFIDGIYTVLDFYYKKISIEIKNRLTKVLDRYRALNSSDTQDEIFTVRFYLAYYETMAGNFEESLLLFQRLEEDFPELIIYSPKVAFRYTLVLAILQNKENMKQVIDKYLHKYLLSYDPDGKVLACLALVAYYLIINDTAKASDYIILFQNSINRKAMMAYDIGIRMYSIALYYQRGDEKFAAVQYGKLIRYLQDRSDLTGMSRVIDLNKEMRKYFNERVSKKISIAEYEMKLNNILKGNHALMAVLFMNAAKIREAKLSS